MPDASAIAASGTGLGGVILGLLYERLLGSGKDQRKQFPEGFREYLDVRLNSILSAIASLADDIDGLAGSLDELGKRIALVEDKLKDIHGDRAKVESIATRTRDMEQFKMPSLENAIRQLGESASKLAVNLDKIDRRLG